MIYDEENDPWHLNGDVCLAPPETRWQKLRRRIKDWLGIGVITVKGQRVVLDTFRLPTPEQIEHNRKVSEDFQRVHLLHRAQDAAERDDRERQLVAALDHLDRTTAGPIKHRPDCRGGEIELRKMRTIDSPGKFWLTEVCTGCRNEYFHDEPREG